MGIYFLILVFVSIAILGLYFSAKTLLTQGWFLKWVKGTSGIVVLVCTFAAGVFAYNLIQYTTVEEGQVIATLRFEKIADQEYEVELVDRKNNRQLYNLNGDQWQLDVRLIKFNALFDGDLPAYKLDRLSGRYLTLEQENSSSRSAYDLLAGQWLDTWPLIANKNWFNVLQVKYGSATFMPMADGAIYQVRLFHDGLDSTAVNDQAKQALSGW